MSAVVDHLRALFVPARAHVARIAEQLRALDEPVHLIGHSYGGFVALQVAQQLPDRIGTIAAYDPVAFGVIRAAHDTSGLADLQRAESSPVFCDIEHGGDPRRIVVGGHSAGGHLAAMMLSCQWSRVAPDLPANLVRSALSISGLFELEPIRHTPFLAPDLRLTAASAKRLSPALMPAPKGTLAALVGGDESEEFLRQNRLIRSAWGEAAVPVCEAIPGTNHFTVLHEFADARSRLHRIALEWLGLAPRNAG